MSEQWMSIVEYARAFAISDMTVRRRIKNGKLKAVLKDGKYYIQIPDGSGMMNPSAGYSETTKISTPADFKVEKGGAQYSPPPWNEAFREQTTVEESTNTNREIESEARYDIKGLVDYCNRSLHRISSIERHLNETYSHKVGRLEAQIAAKDLEIANLKQKVEDLQILIKMYDSNSRR